MLRLLGSRSPPALASWLRGGAGRDPGAEGRRIDGRVIGDRAPAGWRSLVAFKPPVRFARPLFLSLASGKDGEEASLFLADPLGDVMVGDPRPVERIAACLVFSNPVPGREAAFDTWYAKQHLPDVLRVPGYLSARRFSLAAGGASATRPRWRYLAIYEVDYARYEAAVALVAARSGTECMPISDAACKPDVAHFLLPAGESLLCGRLVDF